MDRSPDILHNRDWAGRRPRAGRGFYFSYFSLLGRHGFRVGHGASLEIVLMLTWLNAGDGFFAILTKRRLKRGVFRSVANLQAVINRFLGDHDAQSKPFQWVVDPDKIIRS